MRRFFETWTSGMLGDAGALKMDWMEFGGWWFMEKPDAGLQRSWRGFEGADRAKTAEGLQPRLTGGAVGKAGHRERCGQGDGLGKMKMREVREEGENRWTIGDE